MKEIEVIVLRTCFKGQVLGNLFVLEDKTDILFQCKSLELPDLNNQRRISCIPQGTYWAIKHKAPKFGDCTWIQDVPNRSEILQHVGNYKSDLLGCMALGESHIDMDKDGLKDVTNSKKTIERYLKVLPNKFKITIINVK